MRARWSETTTRILKAFRRGFLPVEEIASRAGIGLSNARTTLFRLYRYRHVKRKKIQDGYIVVDEEEGIRRPRIVYVYTITEEGKARRDWLDANLSRRKLRKLRRGGRQR